MCDVKSSASSVSHFAIHVAIDQAKILLIQRLKLLHIAPNYSSLCKAMNFTHLSAYAWESGQSSPHAVSVIAQDRSCHRKNFVICKTLCYERDWLILRRTTDAASWQRAADIRRTTDTAF